VKSLPTVSANQIAGKLIPRGIYREFTMLRGFSLGTALDRRRCNRYLATLFFLSLLAQFCAQGLALEWYCYRRTQCGSRIILSEEFP
jgi:hypothetical protein